MDQMSMEDILKDAKPEKDPVEKQVEKQVEQTQTTEASKEDYKSVRQRAREKEYSAQGRDPQTGQFIPEKPKVEEKPVEAKVEEKVEVKQEVKPEVKVEPKIEKPAAPQQEFTDKERAFLKGLEEERRKRQLMEKELAELRAKVPASTEPAKTFWDDPEAALKKHQEEMSKLQRETRLQTAEVIARSKYPDFDEKIAVFGEVLQQTPGLHAQWLNSQDPAEFAYKVGKNHRELQEAGDLDSLRAKIEKETRIKIEAEMKAKAEELEKERAKIPPSLSDVRGATTQANRPVWTGPTPLGDILGIKH